MEFQIEYRTQTTVQLDLEKSLKIFEQNQKSNRRYLKIMRIFQDPSQPLDREFQKLFNGFIVYGAAPTGKKHAIT